MGEVYQTYSNLDIRVRDLTEFIENEITLPPELEEVEVERNDNQIRLTCTPADNTLGQYEPTAFIKGTIHTRLVVVDEETGEATHETVRERKKREWSGMDEEVEFETAEIEYVRFQGNDEDVLCNSALRHPMFLVLLNLADVAYHGYVEGIVGTGGELQAMRRDHEGDDIPVEVDVVKKYENGESEDGEDDDTVDWRSNDFISSD